MIAIPLSQYIARYRQFKKLDAADGKANSRVDLSKLDAKEQSKLKPLDTNNDGKLSLQEMVILPKVKENQSLTKLFKLLNRYRWSDSKKNLLFAKFLQAAKGKNDRFNQLVKNFLKTCSEEKFGLGYFARTYLITPEMFGKMSLRQITTLFYVLPQALSEHQLDEAIERMAASSPGTSKTDIKAIIYDKAQQLIDQLYVAIGGLKHRSQNQAVKLLLQAKIPLLQAYGLVKRCNQIQARIISEYIYFLNCSYLTWYCTN